MQLENYQNDYQIVNEWESSNQTVPSIKKHLHATILKSLDRMIQTGFYKQNSCWE